MNNKLLSILATVLILLIVVYLSRTRIQQLFFLPTPSQLLQSSQPIPTHTPDIQFIANNLEIPWEIEFLPNGDYLVTERPGRLLRIGSNLQVFEISGVEHAGEGGLLGLALDPNFSQNQLLFLYLTTRTDQGLSNRVESYFYQDDQLSKNQVVMDNIPGARNHDGGRIKFGPDGYLYITTGDAGNPQSAQDPQSLAGKILRIKPDGTLPSDNPFNNPVYSLGHRNPQGLTWDDQGQLWATEHGRSGLGSGYDELNLIQSGNNYGWPTIQGPEEKPSLVSPIIQSGPQDTWAPAGMAYHQGSMFFTGLRGQSLYQYKIQAEDLSIHLRERYGRLRTISIGPDGYFYLLTSNRDGRGQPQPDDDKIIKINPEIFSSP
jgi:glucose/arabinose dehydrogenase